jgi:Fe2+ transport system protein FeoA
MSASLFLDQLPLHTEACVTDIHSDQLCELGFVPGTIVKLVHHLSFGSILAFEVEGTKIALRRSDAHAILAKPVI